jgi:IS1 family transposase
MNKLSHATRAHILHLLVEGNSLRSASRIADVSINTVTKLLIDAGKVCSVYQDRVFRDLMLSKIQLDEIWAFAYCKQRTLPIAKNAPDNAGDIWAWVAIDADTKLVPSWIVGDRSGETAMQFVCDLAKRLANRVQITSDGHRAYLEAVEAGFGGDVDYAQLIKLYGEAPRPAGRYSPAQIQGTKTFCCSGNPDPKHISTSYVERNNFTMRMATRRFIRLTNAFSKKVENYAHMISLHFMHYNFCRIHKTLRVSPAMKANVTGKLWDIGNIVDLLDIAEEPPRKRGPYKPRRGAEISK